MKLSEIAMACNGTASGECEINGICIDSRKVTPGCLFLAIAGENFDGHNYAQAAVNAGATAVMCHRRVECTAPTVLVRSTGTALMHLAAHYRKKFHIPVVGLTGSVGKTTTKDMVHCVLSQKYKTLKSEGNHNNEIGMPLTALELDSSYQAAIFEMGMYFPGEISDLTRIARPDVGIITNIGVSHIENLGSQENILKAKLEIIDGMCPDSPLLLNGDDKYLSSAVICGFRVSYYGIENPECRFRAVDIEQTEESTRFKILFDGKEQAVTLPTIGLHNVYDALAAFSAGIELGVTPEAAAAGLNNYVPSGMRQHIVQVNGITVIEDCYNAGPDSMKAALGILKSLKTERKIAVLGDMNELGLFSEQAHHGIGAVAAQSADMLFAVGEKAAGFVDGASDAGMTSLRHFDDKKALADELLKALRPGDGVLFKASRGMRLEEVITDLYERWN